MTSETRSPMVLSAAVGGGLLMIGLVAGGTLLGMKVRDFKRSDRYVEAKGLVERVVKSDTATWPISFSEAADDLAAAFAASEKDKAAVLAFLKQQGFADNQITLGSISVNDRSAAQFNNNSHAPRFVVEQTITLQSNDVDKVAAANAHTADLIRSGVIIESAQGQGVTYKFTGLNALKPDMLTEAIRNARSSADRFAADSGAEVGSIRDANQGVFSISAASAVSVDDSNGGFNPDQQADSSIMKKVRVVSTIDYYLK